MKAVHFFSIEMHLFTINAICFTFNLRKLSEKNPLMAHLRPTY